MSGSGGGRDDYTPREGSARSDYCEQLVQSALLNSPNPDVVDGLGAGQILHVVLDQSTTNPSLRAVTDCGEVAGALTHEGYLKLIDCMKQGVGYEATILEIIGGLVKVEIRAVQSQ